MATRLVRIAMDARHVPWAVPADPEGVLTPR